MAKSTDEEIIAILRTNPRLHGLSRRQLLARTGQIALALGIAPLSAATLASCSSDDPSTSGATGTSGSKTVGGTARMAFSDGGPQDTIDPPKMSISVFANLATIAMYDNILVGDDATLQPTKNGIVTDWEVSPDLKTWTLDIRDGVEFHDGTKMTAKDVAYSIQIQVQPNGPSPNSATAGTYLSPHNVKALDDKTVQLVLDKPNSFFYVYLQNRFMRVVKNGAPDVTKDHVGTGPFIYESFAPGRSFKAKRNPNYWQEGKPYLDEIELVQIPEPSAQLQALKAGQVDMIESLTPALAKTLESSGTHSPLSLPNYQWYFMVMDPRQNPLFENESVIRAIKMAVDRDQLINDVFAGFAQAGYDQPIPSTDGFFDKSLALPSQDIDGAKSLLAEAGYPNGVDIGDLNTGPITGSAVNFAVVLQQQLETAGIRCKVKQNPSATYYENVWMKEPLYVSYNLRRTPAEIFTTFYGADAPYPESGLDSPELDAAVASAFATSDFDKQATDFATAQQICYDHDNRTLPLFADGLYGVDSKLVGIQPSPLNIVSFTEAHWT